MRYEFQGDLLVQVNPTWKLHQDTCNVSGDIMVQGEAVRLLGLNVVLERFTADANSDIVFSPHSILATGSESRRAPS
jgi:hypothetical protein